MNKLNLQYMRIRESDEIRVLHVDDEQPFLELTRDYIEDINDNIKVISETNPRNATNRILEEKVDCVVSDYDMIKMTGLELYDEVREIDNRIPFILFTGKGTEEIASRAISKGVTDYVQKGKSDHFELLSNKIENSTEHARSQRELDEVYNAVEMNMDGVAILNQDTEYIYANDSYAEIHGYHTVDELEDITLKDHYNEITAEFLENQVMDVIDTDKSWSGKLTGVRSDGVEFCQDASITQTESNNVVVVIRRQDKKDVEIQKRELIINALIENIPHGVLIENEDREIRAVNPAFADVFDLDYEQQDLMGRDCAEVAEEVKHKFDDEEEFTNDIEHILKNKDEPYQDELVMSNGKVIERTYVPYSTPNGKANMWITYDVTEHRRNIEELKHEKERISHFTKVMGHDLKNPLSVILGRAEILNTNYDDDSIDYILNSADRMEEIIDSVSEVVKHGEPVQSTDEIDVPRLAKETWRNVRTDEAELVVEDEFAVSGDREKLKNVFENLYCNAIEHAGSDIVVTVEETEDGFAVQDNGDGIPEEHIDDIFEFGYSSERRGTGFGLSIVREVAEAHGWDIEVENRDGARFEMKTN